MTLVKWKNKNFLDPWSDWKALQDSINELFDSDRFPAVKGIFDRSYSPAIDVVETADDFKVICELPGLEQEDIDLSIASNVLTIKGTKKALQDEKKGKYYKKESWSGSFQRTLPLPALIDPEKISATLKDGIMTISIGRKEEAKPKQIAVSVK